MSIQALIKIVEAHDASAIEHKSMLLVTVLATQQINGQRISFDLTEKIPATRRAVYDWLGY